MTEQSKEYIITEELLSGFEQLAGKLPFPWGQMELSRIQELVRSHPVSTPPEGAAPEPVQIEHSPCLHCSCMREYFPDCQQNCGISKPARYQR
jgi:hypothetical protein